MERNAAYSIAFSELVTYITETTVACESSNPPIFRLCDLCLLYRERLEQLVTESPAVHATRPEGPTACPHPGATSSS